MSAAPTTESKSQGMILVVVLWAVAMMTVIVVALSAYSQKNLSLAGVETSRLRSAMALQAGIEAGKAMIMARDAGERVLFDGSPVNADIGDGRLIEVRVMDAAGLVDINRADPDLLKQLAARLGISGVMGAAIVSGIMQLRETRKDKKEDGQQQQARQDGSTDGQQQQDGGTEAAAGDEKPGAAVFFSTAQLYGLAGTDPAALDILLPFISLYSSDGKVNPMAAPEVVMQSIPGLSAEEGAILAGGRKRGQWKSQDVQEILDRYEKFMAVGESRIFVIGVKAIAGPGLIAGSRMREIVILDETGNEPFHGLALSW